MQDENLHAVFVEETQPLAAEVQARLLRLERDAGLLHEEWREVLGVLHTIKGNCGMVGFEDAEALAHALEHRLRDVRGWSADAQERAVGELLATADVLAAAVGADETCDEARHARDLLIGLPATPPARDEAAAPPASPDRAPIAPSGFDVAAPAASHVRVAADSLDRLLEATSDLAALHVRLRDAIHRRVPRRRRDREADALLAITDGVARRLGELRRAVLDLRLVPLSTLTHRYDRMVRDLCAATGKRATVVLSGSEVGADKHVVDHLAEPLLHIVRNAIDHGVEPPRQRMLAGKPERATITVEVGTQGGLLTIAVRDDGRGVDTTRLIAAAAARGLDASAWPREQLLELVFAPELSTAATVTSLSGRGVGLDQARRAVERIGGTLQIASEPGVGTELRLRVPLVTAVQRALLVACGEELFALPFTAVLEAMRLPGDAPPPLPLASLRDELGLPAAPAAPGPITCVILDGADAPLGLVVDALVGHEDLMIHELDDVFGRPPGVHGAALLADGRIVTVLDPVALGRQARPERGAAV